jgi:hypothetical protein
MLREQEETMPHYPYLIIGGGLDAAAAVQGIREVDPTGAIGLIGREQHRPTSDRRSPRRSGKARRSSA